MYSELQQFTYLFGLQFIGMLIILPWKSGQIFAQQVIDPWFVYWPRDVSNKNKGMPQENRKSTYGMKNTPGQKKLKCHFIPLKVNLPGSAVSLLVFVWRYSAVQKFYAGV